MGPNRPQSVPAGVPSRRAKGEAMPQKVYDAIVVGSGATGGWAAKQLTEAGMEVLMIESGRKLDPSVDFTEHMQPFELPLRGRRDPRNPFIQRRPTQVICYACGETNADFFIDDVDNPYTVPEDKPFTWIQGNVVGGRSVMWARQSYRMSDWDFKAASKDGFGEDWPISYADLAPYYDIVEDYIGVSGNKEGLEVLPDGNFLPPMALSCGEEMLRDAMAKTMGRKLTIGRSAVLTRRHRGRAACHYCGPCHRGCLTNSYFNSPGTTLRDAEATGKFRLISEAIVRHVTTDERGLADGVYYFDKKTGVSHEEKAKVVVLCASTLASTRILFNSGGERHPEGLANSSDVLGRYLMDHIYAVGVRGRLELRDGVKPELANRPNGIYVPRFQNLTDPKTRKDSFLRGYGYQGGENVTLYEHAYAIPGFGARFKEEVRDGNRATLSLGGFGEMLPRAENRCYLDPEKRDAWDIPVLHIDCELGDNEFAMIEDCIQEGQAMLEAVGCTDITTDTEPEAPGTGIHEVGTARMGVDPKKSVLNQFQQTHDVKNLFVMDGAGYVSVGCVNPTLTMMSLVVRSTEYLIGEYRRGNLA